VADAEEVARARSQRERVGERHLPGLVDEQVVERPLVLVARVVPRRAGGDVAVRARAGVGDVLDLRALVVRLGIARARFLAAAEREARRLDLGEDVVDRLFALRRGPDGLAVPRRVPGQAPP